MSWGIGEWKINDYLCFQQNDMVFNIQFKEFFREKRFTIYKISEFQFSVQELTFTYFINLSLKIVYLFIYSENRILSRLKVV